MIWLPIMVWSMNIRGKWKHNYQKIRGIVCQSQRTIDYNFHQIHENRISGVRKKYAYPLISKYLLLGVTKSYILIKSYQWQASHLFWGLYLPRWYDRLWDCSLSILYLYPLLMNKIQAMFGSLWGPWNTAATAFCAVARICRESSLNSKHGLLEF